VRSKERRMILWFLVALVNVTCVISSDDVRCGDEMNYWGGWRYHFPMNIRLDVKRKLIELGALAIAGRASGLYISPEPFVGLCQHLLISVAEVEDGGGLTIMRKFSSEGSAKKNFNLDVGDNA
jgi:hypothetical protein